MSDPVSAGKKHFGSRYDESIDSECLRLGLKSADMQVQLGNKHPDYLRFLKEEYDPAMKRVREYLDGKTEHHPFRRE